MNTDGPLFIYLAKKVCIIFQLKTKNPYFCVPVMGRFLLSRSFCFDAGETKKQDPDKIGTQFEIK